MVIYMLDKYVDDVENVQESVGLGTKWTGEKLEWREEWMLQDQQLGRSHTNVTMAAVLNIANSVRPWLQFTSEEPNEKNGWRVPMLDVEVWAEEKDNHQILMYSFYEKEVSSDLVIMKKSAMNEKTKVVTLSRDHDKENEKHLPRGWNGGKSNEVKPTYDKNEEKWLFSEPED